MIKNNVGHIHIGKIIIGPLFILIATSNLVRSASVKKESISHMRGKENGGEIYLRFSSTSGVDSFEKYGIQQRLKLQFNHFDINSSNEPKTNSTTSVNQETSIQTTQFPQPSKIVVNMKRTSEAHLKTPASVQESGRSFTVLHMFLKTLKKTLKTLRPEIKLSECAQKYFFSTSESETSGNPPHSHGHTHDKKKKKKKHKHDPDKDYSDHITDGVVSSVFGLHSDFASIIYEEYKPYLHIARSVYKNIKSTFEIIRQDVLMKCTVDYLVARFCIWVDG